MKNVMYRLNDDQLECVSRCLHEVVNSDGKCFVISGSAGVGKTYLIGVLESLLEEFASVAVCAFTGVASLNASERGRTLHSLIYEVTYDKYGNVYFAERPKNEFKYDYLLIDEASMVPDHMIDYLLDTHAKLIFFGDNKQLPPIKDSDFNILDESDYVIRQIMRTKQNDPIVLLSMDAYNNNRISKKFDAYDNINIMDNKPMGKLLREKDYDCIICATNQRRRSINKMIRSIKGYESELPEQDEMIICLKNMGDDSGHFIYNGQRFYVISRRPIDDKRCQYKIINAEGVGSGEERVHHVVVRNDYFMNDHSTPVHSYDLTIEDGHAFTFGYAITAHKSQGKEYKDVLFIDEDVSYFLPQNRFRYTAITRAKGSIDILRKTK